MSNAIEFSVNAETAAQGITAALARRGLRAMRSFDLRTARGAQSGCACPHHGTGECTCQYVVMLVYGRDAAPAVLALHSREAQARVELVQSPGSAPSPELDESVMSALLEAALDALCGPGANRHGQQI